MTIEELFSRYPDLQEFLFNQLSQKSVGLVHPSFVPLLVLFSRISLGVLKEDNKIDRFVKEFKSTFKQLFYSPVINVRKMAAKAYANFTKKEDILQEINFISEEILCYIVDIHTLKHTNYVDGCLCCIHELLKFLKTEITKDFSESYADIEDNIQKLANKLLNLNCYIIRINVIRICKLVNINTKSDVKIQKIANHEQIQPGFRDFSMKICISNIDQNVFCLEELNFNSRENCRKYLASLDLRHSTQAIKSETNCALIYKFLCKVLKSDLINGKMIEKSNEILLKQDQAIEQDSELAMDLLDLISNNRKIALGEFGVMAKTTSLMVQSVCFSSMMTKSDFKMFFGDESLYCSMFSEMSEEIEKFSEPNNMETCRINAAQCLNYLIPMFNMRSLKDDFNHLMLYAFVKLINAALKLLFDEDSNVRELVTIFVSKLHTKIEYFTALSTLYAIEKLVLYGLDQFSLCIEWFSPVHELFFQPWLNLSQRNGCNEGPVSILKILKTGNTFLKVEKA